MDVLGEAEGPLSAGEMGLRVVVVYAVAVLFVRLGDKRFMGKNAAFDLILGIVVGSVLSRAITGNSPLVPTIVAAALLVALHSLLALIAYHSPRFGKWVKGRPRVLVRDGQLERDQMRKSRITRNDLDEALHSQAHGVRVEDVQEARLERNGQISIVPKAKQPQPVVIQFPIRDGVQTVRIELVRS